MKIWRRNARLRLIEKMGGKCVDCEIDDPEKLTFDHVLPLTDEQAEYRREIGANKRMVLNRREEAEGLLELRCQRCQNLKAREPKQGTLVFNHPQAKGDEPF